MPWFLTEEGQRSGEGGEKGTVQAQKLLQESGFYPQHSGKPLEDLKQGRFVSQKMTVAVHGTWI